MKSRPFSLLPPLLALSLICLPLHAGQAIVLQQQMGAEAFHQAGLDKLSPTELQQLQQWLAAHATELASAVPASDAHSAAAATEKHATGSGWFGHKHDKDHRVIVSPVAGPFEGWKPGSVIALQNGQKWRVLEGSLVVPHPPEHPEITVKPGAVGNWLMKVKGYNSSARVEPAN